MKWKHKIHWDWWNIEKVIEQIPFSEEKGKSLHARFKILSEAFFLKRCDINSIETVYSTEQKTSKYNSSSTPNDNETTFFCRGYILRLFFWLTDQYVFSQSVLLNYVACYEKRNKWIFGIFSEREKVISNSEKRIVQKFRLDMDVLQWSREGRLAAPAPLLSHCEKSHTM